MTQDFCDLGDLARKYGVRVGFEALYWCRFVNDHRDAWEVVRRADHPDIGLILDSFHTLARRIDPGDRITFVKMADAPAIGMELLDWSRHFRNIPGEGDVDITGFMCVVAATGYDGPLRLEIFNDQFRAGLPRMAVQNGRRYLIALMDHLRYDEATIPVALPIFRFPPWSPVSNSSNSPPALPMPPPSRPCCAASALPKRDGMCRDP